MRSADRIKCRSSQVTGLCSVLLSLSVHSLNKVFVNNFSFSLSLSLSLSLSFSFSRAYLSLCCSHQRTPPLKGLQATCSLFFFFFFFSLSLSLSLSLHLPLSVLGFCSYSTKVFKSTCGFYSLSRQNCRSKSLSGEVGGNIGLLGTESISAGHLCVEFT